MTTVASQITSLAVVYSIVYSGADERKHQNSASLAFVRGIHRDRWIPRTNGHPDSNDSAVRQRTPRPWQWAGIRRCSASVPPACPIRTWPVQTSAATLPRHAGAPPTQLTHVCFESWAAARPCPARVTPAATDNGKRQRPLTRITWLERFIGYRRHCVACWRLLGEWINILFNLSTVILPQLSPKVV